MSKKFDLRVTEKEGSWTAEIVRRKTAKELIVSKQQDGFTSEAEAQSWGENELKGFLATLAKRNLDRAK
jgi:hypothetical protein